jgi:nicotinic acid phosphoribosyltransferase
MEGLVSQSSLNQVEINFNQWVTDHASDIHKIRVATKENSESATFFNDYYKWTMMEEINKVVDAFKRKKGEKIITTFDVDIRDNKFKQQILYDISLQNKVFESISKLVDKKFNPILFEKICEQCSHLGISNFKHLFETSLIDRVQFGQYFPDETSTEVVASIFIANDESIESDESVIEKPKKFYIRVTGPWERVTWCETTIMQAVYNTFILSTDNYEKLLHDSLYRCYRVCNLINILNQSIRPDNPLLIALFSGRRTLSEEFLVLQNYMVAELLNNAIGTSSVDSWFILNSIKLTNFTRTNSDGSFKFLKPVGTHAHELSMVLGVLFSYLDDNSDGFPLSQLLGHGLFWQHSNKRSKVLPMPMLPDTINSQIFFRAAAELSVDNIPCKEIFGGARQDSGDTDDFISKLRSNGFKIKAMASEIGSESDIYKVISNPEYSTAGIGGFLGDSPAIDGGKAISMAVKAVCIQTSNKNIRYSLKLGDGVGKISIDTTLPLVHQKFIINRALSMIEKSKLPISNLQESQQLLNDAFSFINDD